MVTGTGATADKHALEVNKDRQVSALGNSVPPTVLRLQKCCGK